jgi:hypothetical protein
MNKKMKYRTNILTVEQGLVGLRRSLLLGALFTAISILAGCSNPLKTLNDTISKAVEGEGRVQVSEAPTTKDQIYNCNVSSITGLESSGLMEENPRTKALFASTSRSFTFDDRTGILRGYGYNPLKMTVLQTGSNENSAVGYSVHKGTVSSGLAVFQIKKWEGDLTFLFLDNTTLWTGSCKTM